MKKQICLLLILCSSFFLEAQRHERDFEKIESFKIQYLTEKLDLSPEMAQKFWPVYNQYQKETREILKGHRDFPPEERDKIDFEAMSDAELEKMILSQLNDQKKLSELKIQYFEKFKACLGTRGAANYYRAELDFHRRLMRELGKRRRNSP
tara:strand:+ start:4691 stop:5143 length:453 start_codon:yes stop_codon:yes gene_type:complete